MDSNMSRCLIGKISCIGFADFWIVWKQAQENNP